MPYEYQTYCNYGPAGNVRGKAVYKTGTEAASECPTGTTANTQTGLCEGTESTDGATNFSSQVSTPIYDTNEGSKPTAESIASPNSVCPWGETRNFFTGTCEPLELPENGYVINYVA
jgi:hypothetical protein